MAIPLTPTKARMSFWEEVKLGVMAIGQVSLWLAMIIAGFQVLVYWGYTFISKGVFDSATVQYSIIVAVGAYFCLILDKNKIYEAMKINKELPFINTSTKTSAKK